MNNSSSVSAVFSFLGSDDSLTFFSFLFVVLTSFYFGCLFFFSFRSSSSSSSSKIGASSSDERTGSSTEGYSDSYSLELLFSSGSFTFLEMGFSSDFLSCEADEDDYFFFLEALLD